MPIRIRRGNRRTALFVHNNFPGQFGFIARMLQREGVECASIASAEGVGLPGVRLMRWRASRGTTPGIFQPAIRAEADLLRGRAAAECAIALKESGFEPQVIIGHPGWGETLFLKEVFPRAKQILYGEYYYRSRDSDVDYDPEFSAPDPEERFRVSAKNATMAMALCEADSIVSPTRYQAGLFPEGLRTRIKVIHEGVDTDAIRKEGHAGVVLDNGRILDGSVPVITFINRCFEPLRGYHVFMRALPKFLEQVPDAQVLLIGDAGSRGYGAPSPAGTTWMDVFLDEVRDRIGSDRVHFTGRVGHAEMLAALSVSAAHVYYTYPFVLSWSLLEAMASECLVVASNTAPVREVIVDNQNGLLLDFFDHEKLAETLVRACRVPSDFESLRLAARQTILRDFDRVRRCAPAWLAHINAITGWGVRTRPASAEEQSVAL